MCQLHGHNASSGHVQQRRDTASRQVCAVPRQPIDEGLGSAGLISSQAGLRLDLLHEGSYWFSQVHEAALGPRIS